MKNKARDNGTTGRRDEKQNIILSSRRPVVPSSPKISVALLPPRHATLDRPALLRLTRQLIAFADVQLASLTLILTDDAHSAHFNKLLLNHDGATDIITQSYAPFPGEPPAPAAELYINLHRAWQVGHLATGVSPNRELLLYIAHGLNHLSGHDDATPLLRRAMRRRENAWLKRLDISEMPLFKVK